jgi:hypothetical protein
MAYYNNYQGSGYGGGYQRPYNGGGYQRPYNGGGYQRQQGGYGYARQKKKHSGAKYIDRSKNGDPVITAWNYSRRMGLVKILIAPYKGTHTVDSKTGRQWSNWMCRIEGKGVPSEHFPVLVDESRRKCIIRKYGWVVNPNAPNGGYCGTFTKK